MCRALLGREPVEVGLPCPALAGKKRHRFLRWHHLDGDGALWAVAELRWANQFHFAIEELKAQVDRRPGAWMVPNRTG
jgi:hypothetical protein